MDRWMRLIWFISIPRIRAPLCHPLCKFSPIRMYHLMFNQFPMRKIYFDFGKLWFDKNFFFKKKKFTWDRFLKKTYWFQFLGSLLYHCCIIFLQFSLFLLHLTSVFGSPTFPMQSYPLLVAAICFSVFW